MHSPKPLQERTLFGQLSIMAGLISALGIPMWAFVAWASDKYIDEKYATDAEILLVQADVKAVTKTVDNTNTALEQTVKSVDGLTLAVLDLQRKELADEIYILEQRKRAEGANWNQNEEAELRDKQQVLADLNTQRTALFKRVIEQK